MTRSLITLIGIAALALPASAQAQSRDTDTKTVNIIGTAPVMCFAGTLSGTGSYDLGVLIDTTTGQLRSDLSAPAQVLVGSFCTGRSTITVSATPLEAQNFTATPPSGFARQVEYTATASGWTVIPASYQTAAASNSAATQTRPTSFSGEVTVAISGFATTGGQNLRLVADGSYRGLVTVTIAAVN